MVHIPYSEDLERMRAERDAAFAMSKCECDAHECCFNLVAKDKEIARLRAERDELSAENKRMKLTISEFLDFRAT
jgi:hypothetical protein